MPERLQDKINTIYTIYSQVSRTDDTRFEEPSIEKQVSLKAVAA